MSNHASGATAVPVDSVLHNTDFWKQIDQLQPGVGGITRKQAEALVLLHWPALIARCRKTKSKQLLKDVLFDEKQKLVDDRQSLQESRIASTKEVTPLEKGINRKSVTPLECPDVLYHYTWRAMDLRKRWIENRQLTEMNEWVTCTVLNPISSEEQAIKMHQWPEGKVIGDGAESKVYLSMWSGSDDSIAHRTGASVAVSEEMDNKNTTNNNIRNQLDTIAIGKLYAVKAQDISDDNTKFCKDVLFFHLLADIRYKGTRVIPRMVDAWCHDTTGYLVMEKFDGDIDSYFQTQHGIVDEADLRRMFELAVLLGVYGIIGGDLKIDQYLYSHINWNHNNNNNNSSLIPTDGPKHIVLTDFGFSGFADSSISYFSNNSIQNHTAQMGWPSIYKSQAFCKLNPGAANMFAAPEPFTPFPQCNWKEDIRARAKETPKNRQKETSVKGLFSVFKSFFLKEDRKAVSSSSASSSPAVSGSTLFACSPNDPTYPIYANVLQLEADFLFRARYTVRLTTTKEVKRFGGLIDIDRSSIKNICKGHNDQLVTATLQSFGRVPLFQLSLTALVKEVFTELDGIVETS